MKVLKITCILFISISIIWSCSSNESSGTKQNTTNKQASPTQQTQTPALQTSPAGEPDQFGRKPGDPHYGHGHAPGEHKSANPANTLQTPAAGEPDSRGRMPGDQHYGHDHD